MSSLFSIADNVLNELYHSDEYHQFVKAQQKLSAKFDELVTRETVDKNELTDYINDNMRENHDDLINFY